MIVLLLALAGAAPHPCDALPLVAGSTWRYRAQVAGSAGSDTAPERTLVWGTKVLTVHANDSAVVATVSGWPTDLAWWEPGRAPTVSIIYCAGGRVYHIQPAVFPAAPLPTVAAALLSGRVVPSVDDLVLRLPLHVGDLYGRDGPERRDTFYAWFVESVEPVPPAVRLPRLAASDSLYAVVYRTNPDYTLLGFVPGLGIAHYVYRHHGTAAEAEAWLVDYEATAQARSTPSDSAWSVYRNASMGFTVRYPSDWHVVRIRSADTTSQSVGLRAPRRAGIPGRQVTFWVMRGANPGGLPVEQWYAAQVRAMYPTAPPRTTRASVGGRVAMRMNHEGTLGRDFLFYVALNRTDVLTITMSQPLSQAKLDDVYRRILSSIQFLASP